MDCLFARCPPRVFLVKSDSGCTSIPYQFAFSASLSSYPLHFLHLSYYTKAHPFFILFLLFIALIFSILSFSGPLLFAQPSSSHLFLSITELHFLFVLSDISPMLSTSLFLPKRLPFSFRFLCVLCFAFGLLYPCFYSLRI